MASRPTVQSLAKDLGVSRQTISNAINRPEVVAPDTLERVLKHIHESGYVPSRAARQLKEDRSRQIAIRLLPTFDGINGHILDQFIHDLAEILRTRGYRLSVFSAKDTKDEIKQYETMYAAREIDGVILAATVPNDPRIDSLLKLKAPFVTFGRPWSSSHDPEPSSFSWVDVDGAAGTEAVVRHLASKGHSKIGYISWPISSGAGRDRYLGWMKGMQSLGLETEGLLRECTDSAEEGAKQAKTLVQDGATAIVCASDSLAMGALAVTDNELTVVGFDDTPVARALGMNSVAQPIHEVAEKTVETLFARLGGDETPHRILLTPEPMFRNELTHN